MQPVDGGRGGGPAAGQQQAACKQAGGVGDRESHGVLRTGDRAIVSARVRRRHPGRTLCRRATVPAPGADLPSEALERPPGRPILGATPVSPGFTVRWLERNGVVLGKGESGRGGLGGSRLKK